MVFLFEERRAFVRSQTHTVVLDRDEDFGDFCRSGTGTVARLVRVWAARLEGEATVPTAYLGSVTLCGSAPLREQLGVVLRRLRRVGGRDDRRLLVRLLRRFAGEAA